MFSIFGSKNQAKPATTPAVESPSGWLDKLRSGLSKTRAVLNTDVGDLFARHPKIDEALFEELETALLSADVGVRATTRLILSLIHI